MFEPVPHRLAHAILCVHCLQIRRDEVSDLVQVFQIAVLVAGHVDDLTASRALACFLSAVFNPDPDDGEALEEKW